MRLKNFSLFCGILVFTLAIFIVDLPPAEKTFIRDLPFFGEYLAELKNKLGLDLQGGTHLDYKVAVHDLPEAKIPQVVEGVKTVLERRVNGLGVAEPNIFTSRVGDEYHILVELAGIKDPAEAKEVVGKTIQLAFKEQKIEIDPAEESQIEQQAQAFLAAALADPANFEEIFFDYENKPKITLTTDTEFQWVTDLSLDLQKVADIAIGQVFPEIIQKQDYQILPSSNPDNPYEIKLYENPVVAQLLAKEENVEREIEKPEERRANHILVAFAGAERSSEEITRTPEEAETLAQEILARLQAEEDFATLAQEFSDDATNAETGGDLDFFTFDKMDPEFSGPVFAATEPGLLPDVIKTPFGFHLVELTEIKPLETEIKQEDRVKLAQAIFSKVPDGWQDTGLTGQHFRRADVGSDPTNLQPIVNIYFTDVALTEKGIAWWQLIWYLIALVSFIILLVALAGIFFAKERKKNILPDQILAIGALIMLSGAIYGILQTREIVPEDLTPEITAPDETPVISEIDQAGVDLFAQITKANLKKPLAIFLDGLPIIDTNYDGVIDANDPAYAPTVQAEITNGQAVISGLRSYEEANELAQNLNTGAIPAPVKLVGQFTIGATLGEKALITSLKAGLLGLIGVALFMLFLYRLPGLIAALALTVYGVFFIFALQVFGVVLTLAGVAGLILSIGMAVDANILIFERMREELKLGKSLGRAIEDGFARAFPSIRDSNVSSLITCAILFWFGSSIIQGFALTLAIGIGLSMFSAIFVSRNFLRVFSSFCRKNWLYGIKNSNLKVKH